MSRQHRAAGRPNLRPYSLAFAPAHCAGATCVHAHHDELPWPAFPGLDEPVRCDRTHAHRSHDITTDDGDFHCPGKEAARLPAPEIKLRVARARAAMQGGAR